MVWETDKNQYKEYVSERYYGEKLENGKGEVIVLGGVVWENLWRSDI